MTAIHNRLERFTSIIACYLRVRPEPTRVELYCVCGGVRVCVCAYSQTLDYFEKKFRGKQTL
jgi:hypothetical protein